MHTPRPPPFSLSLSSRSHPLESKRDQRCSGLFVLVLRFFFAFLRGVFLAFFVIAVVILELVGNHMSLNCFHPNSTNDHEHHFQLAMFYLFSFLPICAFFSGCVTSGMSQNLFPSKIEQQSRRRNVILSFRCVSFFYFFFNPVVLNAFFFLVVIFFLFS